MKGARRCHCCRIRLVSVDDMLDHRREFTVPVTIVHCTSPTCDLCRACMAAKNEQCRVRA